MGAQDSGGDFYHHHNDQRSNEPRVKNMKEFFNHDTEDKNTGTSKKGTPACKRSVKKVSFINRPFSQEKACEETEGDDECDNECDNHHVWHPQRKGIPKNDRKHDQNNRN